MIANIIKNENQVTVIIEGRLDTTNSSEFDARMSEISAGDNPDIVLNCGQLSYVSSSGLRAFISLQKTVMAKKGSLVLKEVQPSVKEVLDMTGFSAFLRIE